MYTPAAFALDPAAARVAIGARAFATLVAHDARGGFEACPLPLLLDGDRLLGHVAAANPIWRCTGPALAIFELVDGYVSPSWYPSKAEHGRVVPTWNYTTVHVHGTLVAHQDAAWTLDVVSGLTAVHEPRVGSDWSPDDAPDGFVDGLLRGIVGLELVIDRIEGKVKLSQNRPPADVDGVITANPNALGAAMRAVQRPHP